MKKTISIIILAVLIIGAVMPIIFYNFSGNFDNSQKTGFALDTVVKISAKGRNASDAAKAALDEISRIDRLFNAHSNTSEIYKINASGVEGIKVSDEVFELISMSKEIWEKTDKAFDITLKPISDLWNIKSENPKIPPEKEIENALLQTGFEYVKLDEKAKTVTLTKEGMALDMGAIAKGYAADRAVHVLKSHGIKNALVDLGGNIYALGKNGLKTWKIGLQNPRKKRGEYFEAIEAKNTSVVTSGAYERFFEKNEKKYHHIIDPNTGYPAESGVLSASVICSNSATADALSTAVFVSGEKGAKKIKSEFKNIEIIIFTKDGKIKKY